MFLLHNLASALPILKADRNTVVTFPSTLSRKAIMNKLIASAALIFAFATSVQAQDTVEDKAPATKAETTQSTRTVGDDVRQAGREIKSTAHKARKAVVTRCADGRHTIKGASGCNGHGGVSPTN